MTRDRLVFLDLETTGLNTATDRVWQFSSLYEHSEPLNLFLNPCIPVPPEVCELVGKPDLNKFLADKPTFAEKAKEILAYVNQGTALAGFCILDFDIPILWEEFYRAGQIWLLNDKPILDAGQIFKKKHPRTLEAAVQIYCGREHTGAHDAMTDVMATMDVFHTMLGRYDDLHAMTDRELSKFCQPDNRVDLAGKLIFNAAGVPCYNIGNEKGVPVLDKPQFGEWVLKRDFPEQTKMVLRTILARKDTKQKELL